MRNWQAANWLCTLQLLKVITLLFIVSLSNIIYNFFQPLVINYVQIHPATSSKMTRWIGKIWKVQMVCWKNFRYKCQNHGRCHSTKVKKCHFCICFALKINFKLEVYSLQGVSDIKCSFKISSYIVITVTIYMSYISKILLDSYIMAFLWTRLEEKSAVVIRLLTCFEPLSIYDWLLPLLLNVLHGWKNVILS